MKKTLKMLGLGLTAVLLTPALAHAAILHYTFDAGSTLDFGGGNTYNAVGTFDFDTATLQVINVGYSGVQTGTGPTGPFNFVSALTNAPNDVTFFDDGFGDRDRFIFASSLALGGTIAITNFLYSTDPNDAGSPIAGFAGSVSAGAVPEPASWALMIAGFGAVGAAARRRKVSLRVSFG